MGIKAVLVTHNETATGVRSDVAAVRRAMDAAGIRRCCFVDGVSSIACMDFRMDEWGVDIAVTGSQKGFMLPTGLAIVGASPKAIAAMETAKLPRCFLDFRDMLNTNPKGGFPYTPPVNLLYGLGESLKMLQEEGLDNVFDRHHRLAEGIRRAVDAWGLKLCAQSPDLYSETVSAIVVPEGFDSTRIVVHAAEKYHVAFGVGLGEVAGKVFRIGHLGSLTDVMALTGIACAEMVMADLNLPIRLGSGVAAAQDYYRGTAEAGLRQSPEGRHDRRHRGRSHIPTFEDVLAAHERVRPYIHRTPILTSRFLNDLTGAELFFKCENFQKAAAFKVRGACNAVFGLSDEKAEEGRRDPLQRQPCAVAQLRRRPARHPLPRGHAAHRAAGEEGRGDRLRRRDHGMRALDLLARGGLRRGAGRTPAPTSCIPTTTSG